LQGQGSNNTVNVYDQGSTAPHTYVITGDSLTRDGGTGYGYDVQNVNYYFGSGGNTIDWTGDASGETDTVYTGTGVNTINFGDANNTLNSFDGTPILQGQGSNNTVNIYDQGNTTNRAYVLTPTSFSTSGGSGYGYGYDIQYANVYFGSGANTVDWVGDAAGTVYTANFDGGSDQLSGDYSAATTNVDAAVSLIGSTAAFGNLSVTSQGSLDLSQAATGTITATSINNVGSITGSGHLLLTDSGNLTSGNLNLVLGGTTAGSTYDQVQVGGTATLTGSLSLSLATGFVPTPGQTFTIVEDTAGTPISGTFAGLPNGTLIHVDGRLFQISYSGSDVVLTNVATPQVAANNATVTVVAGTTATNTGTWSQPGLAGIDTITASVGTIVQSGNSSSGQWSWSYPTTISTPSQTVTITANDGQGDTATTTFSLVVNPNSTTSVTSSLNPSVFGQRVTFTATVKAVIGNGVPSGTVTFLDGTTTLGSATLSGGKASYSSSTLVAGSHSITVSYSGSSTYTPSTSAVLTQTVDQATTTTKLSSSNNPSVYGQRVTFTAVVTANAPGGGTPTGTVTFMNGTSVLGSGTLSGGRATLSTSALTPGSYSISVNYSGDANDMASSSIVVTQVVNEASTSATLTSSKNPSVFGQSVTFTATIRAVSPGAGTPTGMVTFLNGTTTLGTETLVNGKATLPTSSLTPGSYAITVSYAGDGNFAGSTSSVVTQVVNKDATTSRVTSSVNPSVFGQSVTFTATVSANSPGSGTPTGMVTFLDGTNTLTTVPLSGGTAAYTTSALSVGSHSITIQYSGDGNFNGSTSSVLKQTVKAAPTSIVVGSSATPSTFGSSVTFTADVSTNSPGSGTPSGTVTFKDGSKVLGSEALNGAGQASITLSSLTPGTHSITASYSATTNFGGSTSTTLSQVVSPAGNSVVVVGQQGSQRNGSAASSNAILDKFFAAFGNGTETLNDTNSDE